MKIRGDIFWSWTDPILHHRFHDEISTDGNQIDVQVRLSRTGSTQMFIGVYAKCGKALFEQAFMSRPGESMSRALAWGIGKARGVALDQMSQTDPLACAK